MPTEVGTLLPVAARRFGRYQLLAKLANGGMAELFLARPDGGGRLLVIKRVLPHLAEDARFVAMFRDEARVAARIDHDHVCRVVDVGAVDEVHFMALEYLHGVPLSRLMVRAMRQDERLPARVVVALGVHAARGLHAAHELTDDAGASLGVVHRDVSPPNLFVTSGGALKVLDFGVAKAHGATQKTRTGTVKGKNAYLSPEQVRGKQAIDRRSDVFALGICLWEGLAGRRLFGQPTDFLTFQAIINGDVPSLGEVCPGLPEALVEVVEDALAHDRDERTASAAELAAELEAAAATLGGPAGPSEIAELVARWFAVELAAKDELLRTAAAL